MTTRALAHPAPRRLVRATAVALAALALGPAVAAGQADRAIELVSPPYESPEIRQGSGLSTPDGETVCFSSETALLDAPVNGLTTADDGFCSWRGAAGWKTKWVTGPAVREPRGWAGAQVYFVSPDGARVAFASDMGIFPDFIGDPALSSVFGTLSAFMWEDGQTRWLAPSPVPLRDERMTGTPGVSTSRQPLAVSEDLSHGIFLSSLPLIPQDTNGLLDLYEWTPDGIRVVSRDADGDPVGGWPGFGPAYHQLMAVPGSVSRDGSRIFFEHHGSLEGSPAGARSVFLREDDELTHVSPRRGPGPAADVLFVGASADGSIAYLSSAEQLTSEPKAAGVALYSYDVAADQLSLVATDDGGIVFLGVSADGSTVVYRTAAPELFVHRDGVGTSLGGLAPQDTSSAFDSGGSERSDKRAMRISADGDTVVFASFAAFDGSPGGTRQVYRWTAANGARWISKDAAGSAPTASAAIGNFASDLVSDPRLSNTNTVRSRPSLGRVMSEDGSRVFFETAARLVAADINDFVDVYEWRGGDVRLVTPGTRPFDSFYHDSSADGGTVFFTTRARLIPALDRNTGFDLYAAREGGGFPLPEPRPECGGEVCQGELPTPARGASPSSSSFRGSGNPADAGAVAARVSVAAVSAAQRRGLARRGRTTLRLRATKRGVVTAVARAQLAGRSTVVARSVRTVRGDVPTGVPLKLSKRARSALKQKRGLRLVISVSYSESEQAIRRVVMLRG